MILTQSSIEIALSQKSIYDYIVDPTTAVLWHAGFVEYKAEKGMPAGSSGRMVLAIMGKRIVATFDVLENDGVGLIRARSTQGPIAFDATQVLEKITARSTRLTVYTKIDAGVVFKLAEPALESIARSRLENDIATLKTLLESSSTLPSS